MPRLFTAFVQVSGLSISVSPRLVRTSWRASAVDLLRTEVIRMSEPTKPIKVEPSLELPREELLRRARPAPPRSETAIEDLTDEEWEAFLAAIKRQ